MKLFLFAVTALSTSMALAYPTLKDTSVFHGTYTSAAGGSIDFNQTIEVTNFDSASSVYTLKNTVVYNGQTNVQNSEVAADQLLTNAKVANILANCSQMGGTAEAVTLPAGAFNTCKVPQERGSQIWVADVPFGFVKEIYIDEEGNRSEVELQSFVHGQ
jgi:putative hemolysin